MKTVGFFLYKFVNIIFSSIQILTISCLLERDSLYWLENHINPLPLHHEPKTKMVAYVIFLQTDSELTHRQRGAGG